MRARVDDQTFGPSAMKALIEGCAKMPLLLPRSSNPSASMAARSSTKSPMATPTLGDVSAIENTP
jgi:hypothetical protein